MSSSETVARDLTDPAKPRNGDGPPLKEPIIENVEIPEDFGPVRLVVDHKKLRRYCFTQDAWDAWYLAARPLDGPVAPPTVVANDLLQLFTTKYDASRVVGLHAEEELAFHRPVRVGETLTLTGRYVDVFERRGQSCVVMEAAARDCRGATVVRHRGVEIMRTNPGAVAGRSEAPVSHERRITGEFDESLPAATIVGADAVPGTPLRPVEREIAFEQMAVFSRIGEFVRNIHNDPAIAAAAGLSLPIVQGQQLVCHLSDLLSDRLRERWFTNGWLRAKFLKPVSAFERVKLSGVVHSAHLVSETEADIDLDVWVLRSGGELAAVGWARCTVDAACQTVS